MFVVKESDGGGRRALEFVSGGRDGLRFIRQLGSQISRCRTAESCVGQWQLSTQTAIGSLVGRDLADCVLIQQFRPSRLARDVNDDGLVQFDVRMERALARE